MHWIAEGLTRLYRIQGVPLPPCPVFLGSTSIAATTEPNDGVDLDDAEDVVDPDDVAFMAD